MNGPAAVASAASPSVDVPASAFESLFQVALQPDAQFAWGLALAGLDLQHIRKSYPIAVWVRALEVARAHAFGEFAPGEGMRKLGRLQSETDLATLAGKLLAATFPMLGARRILERLPRFFAASRPDMKVEVVSESERSVRVKFVDAHTPHEFMAGCLEVMLERCREEPLLALKDLGGDRFEILAAW